MSKYLLEADVRDPCNNRKTTLQHAYIVRRKMQKKRYKSYLDIFEGEFCTQKYDFLHLFQEKVADDVSKRFLTQEKQVINNQEPKLLKLAP